MIFVFLASKGDWTHQARFLFSCNKWCFIWTILFFAYQLTYEIFKIRVAPNFYYGRRGQSSRDIEILANSPNMEYPQWKVDGNITLTMVSLILIYINQMINILIIHIELKQNYRIEIYGWSLFCARGKIKS